MDVLWALAGIGCFIAAVLLAVRMIAEDWLKGK